MLFKELKALQLVKMQISQKRRRLCCCTCLWQISYWLMGDSIKGRPGWVPMEECKSSPQGHHCSTSSYAQQEIYRASKNVHQKALLCTTYWARNMFYAVWPKNQAVHSWIICCNERICDEGGSITNKAVEINVWVYSIESSIVLASDQGIHCIWLYTTNSRSLRHEKTRGWDNVFLSDLHWRWSCLCYSQWTGVAKVIDCCQV